MQRLVLSVLLVACLVMAGCGVRAGADISPSLAEEKFGPLPEDYKQLVMNKIKRVLIDPSSAQYEFYQPQPKESGWYGLVHVNAKNRLGGYVGRQLWEYRIENGNVVEFGQEQRDTFLRSLNRGR